MSTSHVVSLRTYFLIFTALMVLTGVTVAVATVDLGRLNIITALSIAVLKATLVLLYFMHLRYSPRLTWLVVGAAFLWLALMIGMTLVDPLTRGWLQLVGRA